MAAPPAQAHSKRDPSHPQCSPSIGAGSEQNGPAPTGDGLRHEDYRLRPCRRDASRGARDAPVAGRSPGRRATGERDRGLRHPRHGRAPSRPDRRLESRVGDPRLRAVPSADPRGYVADRRPSPAGRLVPCHRGRGRDRVSLRARPPMPGTRFWPPSARCIPPWKWSTHAFPPSVQSVPSVRGRISRTMAPCPWY